MGVLWAETAVFIVFWAAVLYALFRGIEEEGRDGEYSFLLVPILGSSVGMALIYTPATSLVVTCAVGVVDYYVGVVLKHHASIVRLKKPREN